MCKGLFSFRSVLRTNLYKIQIQMLNFFRILKFGFEF